MKTSAVPPFNDPPPPYNPNPEPREPCVRSEDRKKLCQCRAPPYFICLLLGANIALVVLIVLITLETIGLIWLLPVCSFALWDIVILFAFVCPKIPWSKACDEVDMSCC